MKTSKLTLLLVALAGSLALAQSAGAARNFGRRYERRVVPVAGHFLPREAPQSIVQALLLLASETDR